MNSFIYQWKKYCVHSRCLYEYHKDKIVQAILVDIVVFFNLLQLRYTVQVVEFLVTMMFCRAFNVAFVFVFNEYHQVQACIGERSYNCAAFQYVVQDCQNARTSSSVDWNDVGYIRTEIVVGFHQVGILATLSFINQEFRSVQGNCTQSIQFNFVKTALHLFVILYQFQDLSTRFFNG
jgi:hypothetical protein